MKKNYSKTKYLVGAFLATALMVSGCSSDEEPVAPATQNTQKLAGQRLTDDNGVEYTLIDNGDGTETARYDDGKSVTFRRQEDGSLDYLSGAAGLIAGMAAGYFMFHGFNRPAGTWDASSNRYTVNEPLNRTATSNTTANNAPNKTPNTSTSNTNTTANNPTNNANNSNSKVNLSKENTTSKPAASSSSSSSAKEGFGSAGARGGSSSAAS